MNTQNLRRIIDELLALADTLELPPPKITRYFQTGDHSFEWRVFPDGSAECRCRDDAWSKSICSLEDILEDTTITETTYDHTP